MEILVIIIGGAIAFVLFLNHMNKKRRAALIEKYKDESIVAKIMGRMIWQGQTPEQLTDSLGTPVDVDRKVLKTKTKEIWKYNQTGKGRFALRVTLENGEVVGWEQKS
ncbi:hypothetical protein DFR40_0905 [Azonexus fungiphilus]|uniref:DUF2845 domain-containing protein n=1 Tax=Azonexus fungiphilus TaxID=146940 RepID=A0A495WHC1_9RHOO|nr:hypothetical protein [Azonexus fungiphilus]RKT60759.1 hypothetical protein DFR40_0905 [Azonexus fungiphilus]